MTTKIHQSLKVPLISKNIYIKQDKQIFKVDVLDILFIEANRNSCQLTTTQKVYILSLPLARLAEQLPDDYFVRVHRSFVVNLNHIEGLNIPLNAIHMRNKVIPISRRRKDEVIKRLNVL